MGQLLDLGIVGFGIACAPCGPARLWLRGAGAHRVLHISCISGGAVHAAQLLPPDLGAVVKGDLHSVALEPSNVKAILHGFDGVRRILRWYPAPVPAAWAVHALGCVIPWPTGYYVEFEVEQGAATSFQFRGPYRDDTGAMEIEQSAPPDGLVIVRGPFPRGALQRDDMVGPGQTLLSSGGTPDEPWVEVGYTGEHGPALQRHQLVRVGRSCVLVTAQGPRDLSDAVRVAAVEAAALAPMPG